MGIKARLKFKGDIGWSLEQKLIQKYGFAIYSRQGRDWIIVQKAEKPFQAELLVNGELPEDVQASLNKRCNNIVNQFADPDAYEDKIRIRLNNIASTLPPFQRKWIHDWITRQFGEE